MTSPLQSFSDLLSLIRRSLWTTRQFAATRQAPEVVQRAQQERLGTLLAHAREGSAFYRKKFGHLPAQCTDLRAFPVTTKAEMMAHFDEVVTDPQVTRAGVEEYISDIGNAGRLFMGKYAVAHTSGSQGQPTLIVQNQQVLDLVYAFQMTRGNHAYQSGRRLLLNLSNLVRPTRVAVLISQQGFFPSAWVWKHLPRHMLRYVRFLFVPANDPERVAKLNDFSPDIVTASPTTLDLLALQREQLRLPRLRQVATWSETLTPKARERIRAAFPVPLLDSYACGECLFLTSGCPAGPGAHINSDWAIVEVVDEHYQPVPAGQPGHKMLLTNLANTVQPFIRYEVGDRLTMATEPCGCGNRLPRIETIQGRAADFFWVRDATGYRPLTYSPFQHAFDYLHEVREWQAVQTERNHIVIRLEPVPGTVANLNAARQRLEERLRVIDWPESAPLSFSFEAVPHLATDEKTAKFRRMISQTGQPEDLDEERKRIQGETRS